MDIKTEEPKYDILVALKECILNDKDYYDLYNNDLFTNYTVNQLFRIESRDDVINTLCSRYISALLIISRISIYNKITNALVKQSIEKEKKEGVKDDNN